MRIDLKKSPRSIAIPLNFSGPQPNHFDAQMAVAEPMQANGFIGNTEQGGSCNVDVVRLNPHCNGTHTESISHLINDLIPPHEVLQQPLMTAELITLTPQQLTASDSTNTYQPAIEAGDWVLNWELLAAALKNTGKDTKALVIRTLPNAESKKHRAYNVENQPAYFSNEAIKWLVENTAVEHLLVDLPSIDRLHDDGLLSNHRIFWNIPAGSHDLAEQCWTHKTITEMIYVSDDMVDGRYLLNLQVPCLNLNAVPSQPVLYHIKSTK